MIKVIKLKLYPPEYDHDWDKAQKKEAWKNLRKLISNVSYQVAHVRNLMATEMGIWILRTKRGYKHDVQQMASIQNKILKKIIKNFESTQSAMKNREMVESVVAETLKNYETSKPDPGMIYRAGLSELWKKKNEKALDGPIIAASLANAAVRDVINSLSKKNGKEFWNGQRSLPTFRNDRAITLIYSKGVTNGTYLFVDKYTVKITLYGSESAKMENASTAYEFPIHKIWSYGKRVVLDRIFSGEYVPCEGKLYIKDEEVYLNVAYKFEPKTKRQIVNGRSAGIYLGLRNPLICTSNNCPSVKWIGEEYMIQIQRYKQKIMRIRKEIGYTLRKPLEKRKGHGRQNKIRTFNRLSGRIRRHQLTANQQMAKQAVDYALRIGASVIVLEDLKNIYKELGKKVPAKRLRSWAYDELQNCIESIAEKYEIPVVYVDRRDMNRVCSCCGVVITWHSSKRFRCESCGNSIDSDLNESINISNYGYQLFALRGKNGSTESLG